MDELAMLEWVALAAELRVLSPSKADEVMEGLRELVEAQRLIQRALLKLSSFPTKRYLA